MRKDLYSLLRLFFILLVLSVTSILSVQNSVAQSDKADIISVIHTSELRVREHIDDKLKDQEDKNDKNFKDLNDKFTDLKSGVDVNTSKIEGISDQFKSLDSRVNTILIAIFSFGGLFVIFLLGLITTPLWWKKWRNLLNSTQQDPGQPERLKEKPRPFSDETPQDLRYTQ